MSNDSRIKNNVLHKKIQRLENFKIPNRGNKNCCPLFTICPVQQTLNPDDRQVIGCRDVSPYNQCSNFFPIFPNGITPQKIYFDL